MFVEPDGVWVLRGVTLTSNGNVKAPIQKKVLIATPAFNSGIEVFYNATMAHHHYSVDNMWTHASIDDLLPYIKEISQTLPPALPIFYA